MEQHYMSIIRKKNYEISTQRKRGISKTVEHQRKEKVLTNRIVDQVTALERGQKALMQRD
jgi:hypothetical protein